MDKYLDRVRALLWGRPLWIIVGALLTAILVTINRSPHPMPAPTPKALELRHLPLELFYSWLRMLAAYLGSLVFAIWIGTLAATKELRAKILLPILDVLQSIPVLGFFPTAIYWFVSLGSERIGIELAVIFLIFTSQSWNLVFGVYDGIKSIPQEATDALRSFGVGPLGIFRRLYLPAVFPRIVYNSVLSWANGWYFLMACEIIAMGPMSYRVPGLGSFLSQAKDDENWLALGIGILALVLVVVAMNVLLWRPLDVLAQRFKFESTKHEESELSTGEILLDKYRHSRTFEPLRRLMNRSGFIWKFTEKRLEPATPRGFRETRRWRWASFVFLSVFWFLLGLGLTYSCVLLVKSLLPPWSMAPHSVVFSILASSLRIFVGYTVSIAWILPLVFWVHRKANYMAMIQSVAEILGSIPATAFFPLIALAARKIFHSTEVAVLLLLVTGMQWYLLFNVLSGARGLPNDIREASQVFGVRGWLYIRKVFLPCILPSLITGSITAVGGGWNALIIAEYFEIDKKVFKVFGIGSALAEATYGGGNTKLLSMLLFFMVAFIVVLNHYFWQPMYRWSEEKFRLEG